MFGLVFARWLVLFGYLVVVVLMVGCCLLWVLHRFVWTDVVFAFLSLVFGTSDDWFLGCVWVLLWF